MTDEMIMVKRAFETLDTTPKNIFDLGANVGKYSIDFGRIFPKSDIFSFEPVTSTFETLNKNIDDLAEPGISKRIKTYNFGITRDTKLAKIGKPGSRSDKETNSGLYSIHSSGDGDFEVQEAQFRSLSEVCKEISARPDFIKLDIEGCEFEVLDSIKDDILKDVIGILVEVNYDPAFPSPDDVNELLLFEGFHAFFPEIDYDPGFSSRNPGVKRAYNRLWVRR